MIYLYKRIQVKVLIMSFFLLVLIANNLKDINLFCTLSIYSLTIRKTQQNRTILERL